MQVLAGTYTQGTDSEGIYAVDFHSETGHLGEPELVIATINPSWLLRSENRLVVANEHGNADGGGEISVFDYDAGKVAERQRFQSQGADPCHLAISSTRLAVANYSGGTVGLFEWQDEHAGEPVATLMPERTGNHPRQKTPHPHGVYFFGPELRVPDLGGDCVYRFDAGSGRQIGRVDVPDGAGPRHLSPDGAFLVNELDNTVMAVGQDGGGESVSALPAGFSGVSSAGEIQQFGEKLYVSNRGHDSIAVIGKTPELEVLQHRESGGRHPRHFLIAAGGKFVLVANKDSNSILSIALREDGLLGDIVSEIYCPSPVHLLPV